MRTALIVLALTLTACSSTDNRKVGQQAYELKEKTKEAAKNGARELKQAGKDIKDGWNEAKARDRNK